MSEIQNICHHCKKSNLQFAVRCFNCGERLDIRQQDKDMDTLLPAETREVNMSDVQTSDDAPINENETTYKPEIPAKKEIQTDRLNRTARLQIEADQDKEIRYGMLKMQGDLILTELQTKTEYHIPREALSQIVVGRYDAGKDYSPPVDLDQVGGRTGGVSRVHATISWQDDVLGIVDHDSKNGTFLNGKRLVPDQKRVVRDGDVISFGKIELEVRFQKPIRRKAAQS